MMNEWLTKKDEPKQTEQPQVQDAQDTNYTKGDKAKEKQSYKNSFSSSDLGVRAAMNSLGFDNNKIGWDGKNVLYDGDYFLTPDDNVDGVTKTNTDALIDATNNYHKNKGTDNSLVGVTSYTAGKLPVDNVVTYGSDGAVMVGGFNVDNCIIIDGKAYAPKSSVENAVNKFTQSTDYKSNSQIAQKALAGTKGIASGLEDKVLNRDEFKYNPQEDPVFEAYKKMYTDIADLSFDDTYARGVARTGGYANSAALSAANSAYFNYMDRLDDVIPGLADDAYKRYKDEDTRDTNLLKMYGTSYDRDNVIAGAEQQDKADVEQATKSNEETHRNSRDYNRGVYEFDTNNALNERQQNIRDKSFDNDDTYFEKVQLPQGVASAMNAINNMLTDNPSVIYELLFDNDDALKELFGAYGIELDKEQLKTLKEQVGLLQN